MAAESPVAQRARLLDGDSLRHPGHPDQKVHGRRGPKVGEQGSLFETDSLPEGWAPISADTYSGRYRTSNGRATITVEASYFLHGPPDYTARSDEEVDQICRNTVRSIAASANPILAAYADDLDAGLTGPIEMSLDAVGMGPRTVGQTWSTAKRGTDRVSVRIAFRPDLFAPGTGEPQSFVPDHAVSGSMALGASAKKMALSVEHGVHNEVARADPVRDVVVHELGHAVDFARGARAGISAEGVVHNPSDRAMGDLLRITAATRDPVRDPNNEGLYDWSLYNSISGYGKSQPGEAYAESFAEWHMRDVAEPSAAARWYAQHEGWEGA